MPDLDVQLRMYVDAIAPPIDVAEAKGHVQVPGPSRRTSPPRRRWPVVAAAAAAVVVFAVAAVLLLTGPSQPIVGPASTTTPTTTPTTAVTPTTVPNPPTVQAATVESGTLTPTVPFIGGKELILADRIVPLAAEASGGLGDTLGALDPGGTTLVYGTWTDLIPRGSDPPAGTPLGRPDLRILDLATGSDQMFASGAMAPAWGQDGRLAYTVGTEAEFRMNTPYTASLAVQTGLEATPVVWTPTPGLYVTAGWADDALLAYSQPLENGRQTGPRDLVAFDGPGRMRTLASDDATLIAVSGRRAVVFTWPGSASAGIRVIDTATGQTLATLTPDQNPVPYVDSGGVLTGDGLLVVPGHLEDETPVLATFHLQGSNLTPASVLTFDHSTYPAGFLAAAAGGPDHVYLVTVQPEALVVTYTILDCALTTGHCSEGQPIDVTILKPVQLANP